MFKNVFFTIAVIFLTISSANAADNKFSCGNVGGTEEWTIYIDLNKSVAGFFDNDTTAVVPLKDVLVLESNPSQMVYIFEGKDTQSNGKLRIEFNLTRLSAGVFTINQNGKVTNSLASEDGCRADKRVVIE